MIKPKVLRLQPYGNCMVLTIFLSLQVLLDNLDNHKEKLLACNLEPDIYCNQQQKTIYTKKRIKSSLTFECHWKIR